MGHYASGDWGFLYRTFVELSFLAGPPASGGVGVGENGLEPRWVLLDAGEDILDEVFLSDLPSKLRARFARYPTRGDDVRVPMPCRLDQLGGRLLADARKIAPALRRAAKDCVKVEVALTPTYRLRVAEIDDALTLLRASVPSRLRRSLTRAKLVAEKAHSARDEIPETDLVEALADALPGDGPTFLLHMVTWLLWHESDQDWGDEEPAMTVTDDSTLYQLANDDELRLAYPKPEGDTQRCASQAAGWAASIDETDATNEALRERRLEALFWATGLPAEHPGAVEALTASAEALGRLGDHRRAIAELDWALLLRPSASTYNWRGYHKHLSSDLEGAIVDYTAALSIERDALYLCNRAEAYLDLGRPRECMRDARAALRLAPEHETALALLTKAKASS